MVQEETVMLFSLYFLKDGNIYIYCYSYLACYVSENPLKDTTAADASAVTFSPALKTFEMDIADQMGIKEDRIPAKTYWY